jgi:hypothetical protein
MLYQIINLLCMISYKRVHFYTIFSLNVVDVYYIRYQLIKKTANKMQIRRLIYYSKSAVHVSGDIFARHQEHLTVFTTSGNVHQFVLYLYIFY